MCKEYFRIQGMLVVMLCLIVTTACGIRPIKQDERGNTGSTEAGESAPVETVDWKSEPSAAHDSRQTNFVLSDGRFLDYTFQPSNEAYTSLRVRYHVQGTMYDPVEGLVIMSWLSGKDNQFQLVTQGSMRAFGVDDFDGGFSKGVLTVDAETLRVGWARMDFKANMLRWHYNDGKLSFHNPESEYNGWYFYLDEERGPILSATKWTEIQMDTWSVIDHPDFVLETLDPSFALPPSELDPNSGLPQHILESMRANEEPAAAEKSAND